MKVHTAQKTKFEFHKNKVIKNMSKFLECYLVTNYLLFKIQIKNTTRNNNDTNRHTFHKNLSINM